MKSIGVIGSVRMGPWRMPQKVQTLLINQYAANRKLTIDYVVSEFVFAATFPQARARIAADQVDNVVFASAFQLPENPDDLRCVMDALRPVTVHFALEEEQVIKGESWQAFLEKRQAFLDNPQMESQRAALKGEPRIDGK